MLRRGDWVRVKRLDEMSPDDFTHGDSKFLKRHECYGIGGDALKRLSESGYFEVSEATGDGRVYLRGSAYGFLEPMLEPCAADVAERLERIDEEAYFAEMFER